VRKLEFDVDTLFDYGLGKQIFSNFIQFMNDYHLDKVVKKGVVIGFSAGPDSMMLLLAFRKYRELIGDFKICVMHINHMLRGKESDDEQKFAGYIAKDLGLEYITRNIDVNGMADVNKQGIEEAARNARYDAFLEVIREREDLCCVATGHNASDNLETVIFNMLRGAGAKGAAGIPPVRDDFIIRPLLYVTKSDIVSLLDKFDIPYAYDSSNGSIQYTRNYVRHMVSPRLRALSPLPEFSVTRMSRTLRMDEDYISQVAEKFIKENTTPIGIDAKLIASQHPAVIARIICRMIKDAGSFYEHYHVDRISILIGKQDFCISLPTRTFFVCHEGFCYVGEPQISEVPDYTTPLKMGVNEIPAVESIVILHDNPYDANLLEKYAFSMTTGINRNIIKGKLTIRPKKDGDAYVYGGKLRKLKKLFNDMNVPEQYRPLIPVICDEEGVLWVPGLKTRDDDSTTEENRIYLTIAYADDAITPIRFYSASEWS